MTDDPTPADAELPEPVFDLPVDSDPGPDPADSRRPNVDPENPPGFDFSTAGDGAFAWADDDHHTVEPESPYAAYDPTSSQQTGRRTLDLRDEEGRALPSFDERYRDDFEGLAFIGSLSKTFTWLGHRFTIRTLNTDAMLAVGVLTKAFANTLSEGLAYRTATVALCVVAVDGRGLPVPLGPEDDPIAWAWQRFDYAKARWHPTTIDAVHNEFLDLDLRTAQVVDALGKALASTSATPG